MFNQQAFILAKDCRKPDNGQFKNASVYETEKIFGACCFFKRILEATQNHDRCRDDFVWKGIYCKPSCSEILKRPDHELLVCRWTPCHPSLWNMQCLCLFNESLWDLINPTKPLLWFWFYQSCSPSLKSLPFCVKCLLIQQNQWKLKTKSIVFWPAMLLFALNWWEVDPVCHTGY